MDGEGKRKWKYREASTRNIARLCTRRRWLGRTGVESQKRGGSRAFISLMTTGRCGLMRTWPVTAPGCSARRISTRTTEIRDKWMKYGAPFRTCYAEFGWLRSPAAGIARVLRFEIDVREVHRRAAVPFFVFPCLTMRSYTQLVGLRNGRRFFCLSLLGIPENVENGTY